VRCRKEGVSVPAVLGLDWDAGWLAMEWIEGRTVRKCLDEYLHTLGEQWEKEVQEKRELWDLMARVGKAVARMHDCGITHGDLTTSNLMVRMPAVSKEGNRSGGAVTDMTPMETEAHESTEAISGDLDGEVVIIDFGLAVQTVQDEDRAVDLYVLERAFGSTHPQAEGLFKEALRVYGESYKGAKVVLRRLEDVRQRGRKKSMIG